jgi:hypothetical protein
VVERATAGTLAARSVSAKQIPSKSDFALNFIVISFFQHIGADGLICLGSGLADRRRRLLFQQISKPLRSQGQEREVHDSG